MIKITVLPILILFLASCGGGKIDLNNDEQVLGKLNTEERDGSFIYTTISEGSNIKEVITANKSEFVTSTYMNERPIIDFRYTFTLGEVSELGREIVCDRSYGKYYYTVEDKILHVTDKDKKTFDFVVNRD